MSAFSAVVIGNESLLIQCAEILRGRGHAIRAVVTQNPEIRTWAASNGLKVVDQGKGQEEALAGESFDWLFSIANLVIIPDAVLSMAGQGGHQLS